MALVVAALAPGRHAGEPDAVLDDPVEFAVRLVLRGRQAHVRRLRKQVASHLGVAAAVVRMAGGAVIGEVRACFRPHLRRKRDGIRQVPLRRRHAPPVDGVHDDAFDGRWQRPRAESVRVDEPHDRAAGDQHGRTEHNDHDANDW